ncbi:MAG: FG-GAP repeat protein [Gammaproteobacteria bacterium]|nr:FG-GAP repeat protein [Gammaproteobacteria bacterium]MDH3507432.1 FG-GAP repeat protein [Gammaproteobacteria bacterium]
MTINRLRNACFAAMIPAAVAACGGGMDAPMPAAEEPSAPATMSSPAVAERVLEQIHYVKASNTGFGDQFGTGGTLLGDAVALSDDGSTLAVGATFEASGSAGVNGDQSDDSVYGAGAVYVFSNDDGNWTQQAYIKASNPGLTDNFGYAVELSEDGNTLAVSAYFEASGATGVGANQADDSIPQAGAVYIFTRNGESWSQQAYLKASNTGHLPDDPNEIGDGDQFGFAIALSDDGNTLAVGAIAEDGGDINDPSDNSLLSAGAVYVFERSGAMWTQEAYLKPSNVGQGDLFGYSLALTADANTLVVGSYDEDGSLAGNNDVQNDDQAGSGAIYVFEREGDAWVQTAYLKGSYVERNDSIGVVVDISDDGSTLVSTALDEDSFATGINPVPEPDWESDTSTGGVYVFVRDGDGWAQEAYLKASNTGREDWFGSRLELSGDGDTLVAGAQLEDSSATGIDGEQNDDSAQEAGVAYLFTRDDGVWSQRAYIKGSNTEAYDEFGSTLSLSRDGRLLAIGARGEDSGATGIDGDQTDNSVAEAGAVYLFSF